MRYTTIPALRPRCASSLPHGAGDCLSRPLQRGQIEPAECACGRQGCQSFADAGTHPSHQFFPALDDRAIARKLVFADLPGYGYAKISKSISAEWPEFIEPYLANRSTLKLCVCLVDSNIPPQQSDRQLIDWLRHAGRDFVVVATKIDRLSGNVRTRNLLALKKDWNWTMCCRLRQNRLRREGSLGSN